MRPFLDPVLALLVLPVLGAPAPLPASSDVGAATVQEREQDKEEPKVDRQEEPAKPQLVALTKVARLAEALLAANGGAENLAKFSSLQFTLTPVDLVPVAQAPGETGPRTYEEKPRAAIQFQASFQGDRRLLRMDEPIVVNGREVVTTKILRITATGEEVAFKLDGKNRTLIKEMRQTVVQDLLTISSMPDLLFGLITGQLRGTYDGTSLRDGVTYDTVVASFASGQSPEIAYRIFFNPTTHLIDSWQVHDLRRKEHAMTAVLGGYATFGGLQLPASVTFNTPSGDPIMRWDYSAMVVNAEIDPARFGS